MESKLNLNMDLVAKARASAAKVADDVIDGDENTVPDDNVYQITRPIKSTDITEWVSGRKYTYILNLGDNKEEILFQVKVDPWDKIEYENEIEIE